MPLEARIRFELVSMDDFRAKLSQHLLRTLAGGAKSFQAVLRRSRNCDPALLVDMIRRLQELELVASPDHDPPGRYCLTQRGSARVAAGSVSNHPAHADRPEPDSSHILRSSYFEGLLSTLLKSLPEPSPVYSQWWFSEDAYPRLISLLLSLSKGRESIAFLGAATLGTVFSHCSDRRTTVIDVDEALLRTASSHANRGTEVVCQDIADSLDGALKGAFDIVFVDPPWARVDLRSFLIRSAALVSCGGTLLFSLPPIFTRPSAEEERASLLQTADTLGLSLSTVLPTFTQYCVPPFEHQAYKAYGVELSEPWRQGDVFVFVKRSTCADRLDFTVERNPKWDQYDFGGVRLFLRNDGALDKGPISITPVPGQEGLTYSSTSSRTLPWKRASLVSTRNEIARVWGTRDFAIVLEDILKRRINMGKGLQDRKDLWPETQETITFLLRSPRDKALQREEIR